MLEVKHKYGTKMSVEMSPRQFLSHVSFCILGIMLFLFGTSVAEAFIHPALKYGYVYSRSVLVGPSGKPIFVEYNADGTIGREFGEAVGDLDGATIMAASTYQQYVERLKAFQQQDTGPAKNAYLMTAAEYRAATFSTVGGLPIHKPQLNPTSVFALVRANETLISPEDSPLLMEAPINLQQYRTYYPPSPVLSVLLKKDGSVYADSTSNIGLKADFWNNDDDKKNNKYVGPMSGVYVRGPIIGIGGGDITNQNGKYAMSYLLPPCPGFIFDYNSSLTAELHYKNFNPRGQSFGLYSLFKDSYDICNGLGDVPLGFSLAAVATQISLIGLQATAPLGNTRVDFPVDVIALSGRAHLESAGEPVSVGGSTEYRYNKPNFDAITYDVDYDGDGNVDSGVRGKDVTDADGSTHFSSDPAGDMVGIYLSSGGHSPSSDDSLLREPDFKRVVDKTPDFQDQGLLSSISTDDLKNTDVYLFRESNGMLITERLGLKAEEMHYGGVDNDKIYYLIMVRGPKDSGLGSRKFEELQSRALMNEALIKRASDQVRPGEMVKLVAINRATGYIGTLSTPLQSSKNRIETMISFPLNEIVMRPPNLKVQVKRHYSIKDGLTGGKDHDSTIGFEGGSLSSDASVELTTEWYDQDGSPLPEGLGEYGYTGRLSIIVNPNELYPVGGVLANFSIRPGTHKDVLKLSDQSLEREHFYVHVSGVPKSRTPGPDFQTVASSGDFAYRPLHFVPIKVPVYDEQASLIQKKLWKDAKREGKAVGNKPEPIYRWLYRPEMQFSSFEFNLKELTRGETYEHRVDMSGAENPGVSSTDRFVSLIYDLVANKCDVLPPFGPERELIFALGQDEIKAELDSSRQVDFTNLDHLAALDPEDFLSMRLYLNNDPENVLWEYAFDLLLLSPDKHLEQLEVSADDPNAPMLALIAGYSERADEDKHPYTLRWTNDNSQATFTTANETNSEGKFETTLVMPRKAGERAHPKAMLGSDADSVSASGPEIVVVPGAPYSFDVDSSGATAIGGVGEISMTVTIKDRWGNRVSDGTLVNVSPDSDLELTAEHQTVNGVIHVSAKGEMTPGNKTIHFTADDAVYDQQIHVANIELRLSASDSVAVGGTLPVHLTAVAEDGVDINGTSISLGAYRGRLDQNDVVLNNGEAFAQFSALMVPGRGKIQASFASSSVAIDVAVTAPDNGIGLNVPVIIGDKSTSGSVEIDDGSEVHSVPYSTVSQLTINGEPGAEKLIRIGSMANPAITPILRYPFSSLGNLGEVVDLVGTADGVATNVSQSREGSDGPTGSFEFRAESHVDVPDSPVLARADKIGFSVKINPWQINGTIVDYRQSGQKLSLLDDGRIRYEIETAEGSFNVDSSPIDLNSWHQVSVKYSGTALFLQVDDVSITSAAHGVLANQGVGLRIGGGFVGLMQDFKVVDWTVPGLANLPNGQQEMTITLDANGHATIPITGTNVMPQPSQLISMFSRRGLITKAYASQTGYREGDWNGDVYVGDVKTPLGIISENSYKRSSVLGFASGFLTGDTSSSAAIAGDVVMGIIPILGDGRDILIQGYNFATDNGEFRSSVFWLAVIGLAADSLDATVVGAGANAAIAGAKSVMKSLAHTPFSPVMAKYLGALVHRLHINDVSDLKRIMPFLQFLAAIALDDDLRAMIGNGILTITDVDTWVEVAKVFKEAVEAGEDGKITYQPDPTEDTDDDDSDSEGSEFPPPPPPSERQCSCDLQRRDSERFSWLKPSSFVETAFADSALRAFMKDLLDSGLLERLHGSDISLIMGEMRKLPKGLNHSRKMYVAGTKLFRIGGQELIDIFKTGNLRSIARVSNGVWSHGTTMDELADILTKIDLNKLDNVTQGRLASVIKKLGSTDAEAIGAAHQLKGFLRDQEKFGKDALLEVTEDTGYGFSRRFDGKNPEHFTEAKTWNPARERDYIERYLVGDSKNNPQLAADLFYMMKTNNTGAIRWLLNKEARIDRYPGYVKEIIESKPEVRNKMMQLLDLKKTEELYAKLDACLSVIFTKLE